MIKIIPDDFEAVFSDVIIEEYSNQHHTFHR